MSDVSSVTNHFATANEDFATTTSGVTTSGGNVVNLNSVSGLTNASIFVGVIEPGGAKEQVFTGVVDVSGSRITGVVWTKGTNVEHASGVAVVDYDTGTAFNMMRKGILVQHKQDGTHANTITTNTINENTAANGVTIDGLNIKDGVLNTASSVIKSNLEKPHYNCLYYATNDGQVFSTQTRATYSESDTVNGYGITAYTGASARMVIARDGIYTVHLRFRCIDVSSVAYITWIYIQPGDGNTYAIRRPDQALAVSLNDEWTLTQWMPAGTIIWQDVYSSNQTRFGRSNDGGTAPAFDRINATSMTVYEIR